MFTVNNKEFQEMNWVQKILACIFVPILLVVCILFVIGILMVILPLVLIVVFFCCIFELFNGKDKV